MTQQKRLYWNETNEWTTEGEFYVRAGLAVVCGETEPTIVTDVAATDDGWAETSQSDFTTRLEFGAGPNFAGEYNVAALNLITTTTVTLF